LDGFSSHFEEVVEIARIEEGEEEEEEIERTAALLVVRLVKPLALKTDEIEIIQDEIPWIYLKM